MMGDLTGMDVHARLVSDPAFVEERLVFTTGGAYTERARRFVEERALKTLHKPFQRDDVLKAVERALAASAP
jgi:FixJ family two-component response regulator